MRFSKQRTAEKTGTITPSGRSSAASGRLDGFSITQRILMGFGIVLVLLGGIGAAGFLSARQIGGVFGELQASTGQTAFIAELSSEVWIAQVSLREYLASPTEETASDVREHLAKAFAGETKIARYFADDPETGGRLRELAGSAGALTGAFETLVVTETELEAEAAELDKLTADVRQKLNGLVFSATISGDPNAPRDVIRSKEMFLDARYSASRFIASADEGLFSAAVSTAREARSILDTLALRSGGGLKDNAQALIAVIDQWTAVLQTLAGQMTELARISEQDIAPLANALQQGYSALNRSVLDRQRELGPFGATKIEQTMMTLAIGVGVAFAVGIALALLIGRWISRSVARLSRSMDRLASGDLSVEIVGAEHRHELGSMARAMGVFRDNAQAMETMQAEKAETDARNAEERREMMAALGEAFGVVVGAAVAGDFSMRVTTDFPDPELKALADGVNHLMETTDQGVSAVVEVIGAVADGDLTARMHGQFAGDFGRLQADVNRMVVQLSALVIDMHGCGGEISTDSRQIASGSTELSGRAENQAASLQETAATMEEMSATIKTNADAAALAADLAREASTAADHGGRVVSESVEAMRRIEESSSRITDIISVIDGIAFQTNLLALNAAVEAARAGEMGKGFAIVASEVRTLAQRSAEAATSVKDLVTESAGHVGEGVKTVEETGRSLETIVDTIRKVTSSVDEISSASVEQAAGVQEVTSSISAMDTITQQNTALAEESAATARRLAEAAVRLEKMIQAFKTDQTTSPMSNAA